MGQNANSTRLVFYHLTAVALLIATLAFPEVAGSTERDPDDLQSVAGEHHPRLLD